MSCEHKPVQREVLLSRSCPPGFHNTNLCATIEQPGTGMKVWVCELCGESLYEVPA